MPRRKRLGASESKAILGGTPSRQTRDTGVQASRMELEEEPSEKTAPPYKDLLNSAMEYVALFRVNRPSQSDSFSVQEVTHTEDLYLDLLQDVRNAMLDIKSTFDSKLSKSIKDLALWLSKRASKMEHAHIHEVEIARSAFRARQADTLSRMSFDAEKNLKRILKLKETECSKKIIEIDREIFKTKKDAHQKAYEVSKLRAHVARYQMILRKHGITESDAYLTIDDERIKTEDVIEHYQNTLAARESKVAELTHQLNQLEEFVEMQGWKANNKASWHIRDLLDASNIDGGSRRVSLAGTEKGRPAMSARHGPRSRRNSITGESDGGGGLGSDNGSDISIAMPPTAANTNSVPGRPAPPSRAGQPRRTHFSELGRVIERDGTAQQRASRPPTSHMLRPMSVAAESKSRQVSVTRDDGEGGIRGVRAAMGGMNHHEDIAPVRHESQEIVAENLITEEEAMVLAAQLQCALDDMGMQVAQEKADIVRISREFRERFEELQIEISKDGQIVERLSRKQPQVINLIHYVFPVGVKPHHCNKAVQCDLDVETAAQMRAPSPKRARNMSISK
ncbi:hypothetical protein BC829DRAFT_388564 [Chytridium lagenaria]|nr:hypothetical protein BC829DRAFT_388564 [Chytridium lagenaria]